MNKKYDISAFYFPNFHRGDKHNVLWHGKNWSEWELVKKATPRFEGHDMPKVPLWGYEDESEITVMKKKILTAEKYGITNLIFDWYWYKDGPFLNKPLDEAFLKCNDTNVKFSLMWANHDWGEIHPVTRTNCVQPEVRLQWNLSENEFLEAMDFVIDNYFTRKDYYRLDGKLFFSIYEIQRLFNNYGGVVGVKKLLDCVRKKVAEKGLGEVHFNAVMWGVKILYTESETKTCVSQLKEMGFDSVTTYVWIHEHILSSFPTMEYSDFREICQKDFNILTEKYKGIDYYPNVTCGWDPSPRTVQTEDYDDLGYPFTRILANNTPEEFKKALISVKNFLDSSNLQTKMFTINAWNEWTEGSYLEPDTEFGYQKLQAIKDVFGGNF